MEWIQFAIFFVGVFGLFIWTRSEGRSDWRNIQDQIVEDRREFVQSIRSIEKCITEIKLENREFHCRLLEIERSRK